MSVVSSDARTSIKSGLSTIFDVELKDVLPIIVVLALVLFFSVSADAFASVRNFGNIAAQAATLLIVCLGATFVVLMGSIDLSVGAIVVLTGAVSVKFLNVTGMEFLALPFAAIFGACLGLLNGVVYSRLRIQSFVVTLGSLSVFSGLAFVILQGQAIELTNQGIGVISIGELVPYLPNIALCAIIAWCVTIFVASGTKFGRYMYLIGGGELVAKTAGVPVRRYKVYAFMASGLLAGLGAILSVARLGASGPTLGSGLLLNSLAAIVVGGTSLAGGRGGPHRTLIGVLIIAILDNGLNLLGVSSYWQMVVKGAVVIGAVWATRVELRGEVVK